MRIPLRNHSDKPLQAETQILRDEPAWDDATVEKLNNSALEMKKNLATEKLLQNLWQNSKVTFKERKTQHYILWVLQHNTPAFTHAHITSHTSVVAG